VTASASVTRWVRSRLDPAALVDFDGGGTRKGTIVVRKFTTTDGGDEMLRLGIVVPMLTLDDAAHSVVVAFPEWEYDTDWTHVPIVVGGYSVDVRGFRRLANRGRNILDAGFV
jgi:hypothetical protein